MKETLKYYLERKTPVGCIARRHRQKKLKKKYDQWKKAGAVGSMPDYGKQQTVIEYIKHFSPSVFIETGTYKGRRLSNIFSVNSFFF